MPGGILVLLPETDEDEAAHLANRIERGYRGRSHERRAERGDPDRDRGRARGADPVDAIDSADRRLGRDPDEELEDAS